MKKSVRFIRRNGRIIPIGIKATNLAVNGAIVGAIIGGAVMASRKNKEVNLEKELKTNLKDTRGIIKKSGMKNINVLSSNADVEKHFVGFANILKRNALKAHVKVAQKGQNAFAFRDGDKDFIITGKKANRTVVGHELGHIKDFRRNGALKFYETGIIGSLTGNTLKREKAAWKVSPFCKEHGMQHSHARTTKEKALSTYQASHEGSKYGAIAGALGGLGLLLITKGK